MSLWKKIQEKEKSADMGNDVDKRILRIINTAFGLPDDIKEEVIEAIDKAIKHGLENGTLNYLKVIELACDDYTKEEIAEAYGHQLLGAYVAYLILTGKPLRLK
ncbi:hypothetical protein QIT38_gp07 [Methanocaldococcus fervens tailed virus 1]|uniref:Uncharacterized protein n=2 Tax=root TaxID=1 RepID=C7P5G9_METFA|nr:hypothetical protein [Methanocaldococcus fervens]YP_010772302.1 hypothetical protein QIT38_gp07 [Methanocaldococcus fervens tailed virus 1]ACV25347.1 hypothetical protein Mefer_1544 [Methanocaldococcus fervens AG86]QNO11477.1 hypothetical protein [Methanocaldococcus fervens tailed virus 1]